MFKEYLEYKKTDLAVFFAAVLSFAVFAKIGGCKWLYIIIALCVSLVVLALITSSGYKKYQAKHQALEKALENIKKLPVPEDIFDEDYLAIIKAVKKNAALAQNKAERERNALYNYFSGWYEKSVELRKSDDSDLIELNNTALHNYMLALSGGFEPQEVSVDEIVRECVMKYNARFINKKIGIGVKKIGLNAYCDANALKFVIEQLLADCLVRTEKGGVKLYADKSGDNALIIEDSSEFAHTPDELFAVKNTGVHTVLAVCRAIGINCESASEPGRTAFRLEFKS